MSWLKRNKKEILVLISIILISVPALLPLFHKGFFVTDDGEWMIIRFTAFYSAFKDGQIPVRFLHSLNSGYGYPVSAFLYPGFMYLSIPVQVITSNFVNTIKIIIGLSLLSSSIFIWLWLRKFFSKTASLIGAVISLYLPYHLFDAYTRGSVGELLALAFVPFILWNIERKSIFFTSIGISLLILSHNTLALLFIPIILVYISLKSLKFISSLIFGICCTAFFIIPAVLELKLTNFSVSKISDPLSYFADPNLVGFISDFTFITAMIIFIFSKNKTYKFKKILVMFLIISLICLFLSTSSSTIIWKVIPSAWIQFPFRILSILVISIPFLSAFIINELNRSKKIIMYLSVIILTFINALPFISPKGYFDKGDAYYFTNQATTTVHDEYMPVWVKQKPTKMPDKKVEIINGDGNISNIFYNNKKITFTADLKKDTLIQINTIFWPGWEIEANNRRIKINFNNPKGVMQFNLPKGNFHIEARFDETPLRLLSDFISILSFLILLILCRTKKLKNV